MSSVKNIALFFISLNRYSAIDMSTYEALKLTYLRSAGLDEPGVLALLAFGSVSGSVGAISVYPLNLVRTRLQASGSPGHPQRYAGVWDVVQKTYQRDGWRGFYRGLLPTLAKVPVAWYLEETHGSLTFILQVVPSVSISYLVYEHSKRRRVSHRAYRDVSTDARYLAGSVYRHLSAPSQIVIYMNRFPRFIRHSYPVICTSRNTRFLECCVVSLAPIVALAVHSLVGNETVPSMLAGARSRGKRASALSRRMQSSLCGSLA